MPAPLGTPHPDAILDLTSVVNIDDQAAQRNRPSPRSHEDKREI